MWSTVVDRGRRRGAVAAAVAVAAQDAALGPGGAAGVAPAGDDVPDEPQHAGHREDPEAAIRLGFVDLGDLAHEHPDRVFDGDPAQRSQVGVEDKNGVHRASFLGRGR